MKGRKERNKWQRGGWDEGMETEIHEHVLMSVCVRVWGVQIKKWGYS